MRNIYYVGLEEQEEGVINCYVCPNCQFLTHFQSPFLRSRCHVPHDPLQVGISLLDQG